MIINYLDNIRLRVAYKIADLLAKTNIDPYHVTLFRFVLAAPVCAYFFSRGNYVSNVIGLLVYVGLAVLDWVDGRLARITGRYSAFGKWLDETSDKILMAVVLVSLFFPGIASGNLFWSELALAFFVLLFLLSVVHYDFNRMFEIDEFVQYEEIEKKLFELSPKPGIFDRFFINFLNIHRSAIAKLLLCISYILFIGIIVNQLFGAFFLITAMMAVRIVSFFILMALAVRKTESRFVLVKILRSRMKRYINW